MTKQKAEKTRRTKKRYIFLTKRKDKTKQSGTTKGKQTCKQTSEKKMEHMRKIGFAISFAFFVLFGFVFLALLFHLHFFLYLLFFAFDFSCDFCFLDYVFAFAFCSCLFVFFFAFLLFSRFAEQPGSGDDKGRASIPKAILPQHCICRHTSQFIGTFHRCFTTLRSLQIIYGSQNSSDLMTEEADAIASESEVKGKHWVGEHVDNCEANT